MIFLFFYQSLGLVLVWHPAHGQHQFRSDGGDGGAEWGSGCWGLPSTRRHLTSRHAEVCILFLPNISTFYSIQTLLICSNNFRIKQQMANQCFEMTVQLNAGIRRDIFLFYWIAMLSSSQRADSKLTIVGKSKRPCSTSQAERELWVFLKKPLLFESRS